MSAQTTYKEAMRWSRQQAKENGNPQMSDSMAETIERQLEGMLRALFPDRYTLDPAGGPAVAAAATEYVRRHFSLFEAELARRPDTAFFCGTSPSILDIYVWMLCFWLDPDWLAENCPTLAAHWQRMRALPALTPIEQAHFG